MKTFQVFTEDQEAQIVKLSTPTSKCFSQEIRHPSNHSSVKITAETRNGPFYVRLYTHFADKHTDKHSKETTLKAAYKWAAKQLGTPVNENTTFANLHPKQNQWQHIPVEDLEKAKHESPSNIDTELFNLLDKSYAYVGGHVDFKKPSDLPGNHTIWYGIDFDGDNIPDALRFGKKTPYGTKWTGGASNGTPEAKQKYLEQVIQTMVTPGNFCEMSDAIMHIMITRHHVPCVDVQADVEKILGKKVKWIGAHPDGKYPGYKGFYIRSLAGDDHMKILLGEPTHTHYEQQTYSKLTKELGEIETDNSRLTLPTSSPDSMDDKSFTNY